MCKLGKDAKKPQRKIFTLGTFYSLLVYIMETENHKKCMSLIFLAQCSKSFYKNLICNDIHYTVLRIKFKLNTFICPTY